MSIFTIFEVLYEIWNLFHWIRGSDEMTKFQNLPFKDQIQEMKFRFTPFMLKAALLLYMLEDMT